MGRDQIHRPASRGEYAADHAARLIGSWRFLGIQTAVVLLWVAANVWLLRHPFDPWPLIFLNLLFSTQAAYTGPVLLIAANRAAQRDRARDDHEAAVVDTLPTILDDIARRLDTQDDFNRHYQATLERALMERERHE